MDAFFFRVEHDLLRSESFRELGGSAIKVYLVIGLYSDFGTGWAFPSIRTIAKQAGLSRQTVITAIEELARVGLLASQKSSGRANAYRIIRQAPQRDGKPRAARAQAPTGPLSFEGDAPTGPESFDLRPPTGPIPFREAARALGRGGPGRGPEREPSTRATDSSSVAILGTPFRIAGDGRLLVAVDLQGLLTDQGLPRRTAERLVAQKDPEAVAKVLLNALYLKSQGKLQNGPGYIRAGIEEGYDLLPQVATQLESRRRELAAQERATAGHQARRRAEVEQAEEEEAIRLVLEQLRPEELADLVERASARLPAPLVRRNPTLSNPFVRAKVYELAAGEPDGDVSG